MTPAEALPIPPSERQRLLLFLALIGLPVLSYAPGLTSPRTFYDDPLYMDRVEYTQGLDGLWSLWAGTRAWHGDFLEYFPLRDTFYWALFQGFEKATLPYHLCSLFLHIAATLLVFKLIEAVARSFWVAAAASLLFAVHPIHIESVVWIAGLKDPLYTAFVAGSLWMYCLYLDGRKPRHYAASLVLLVGALLCKSMAISTPLIMLAMERLTNRPSPFKQTIVRLVGPGLITAMFLFQFILIGKLNFISNVPHQTTWVAHWVLTSWAQVAYVRQAIFPANFRLIYCFTPASSYADPRFIAGIVMLAGFAGLAWFWRRHPLRLFCLAIYFACLLPAANLLPFPAVMADRYLYAASIGVCFLLALLLDAARPRLKNTVVVLAVVALALTTATRSYVWQDEEGLWAEADEDPACLTDPEFPAAQAHFLRYHTVKDPEIKLAALDRLLLTKGPLGDSHGLQCEGLLTGARLLKAAGRHEEAERRAQLGVKPCLRHPKLWETVLTVTLHRNLPVAEVAARKWARLEPSPATHLLRVLTRLEVKDTPELREEAAAIVLKDPELTCQTLRDWSTGLGPELLRAIEPARAACR